MMQERGKGGRSCWLDTDRLKTKVIDGKSERGTHPVIRQPMKRVWIPPLPLPSIALCLMGRTVGRMMGEQQLEGSDVDNWLSPD